MNPKERFHPSWYPIMPLLSQQPLLELSTEILPNISHQPRKEDIFNVFSMPVGEIRTVILGQDPYPKPGEAMGYSFATTSNKTPASLRVIKQEVRESGAAHVDMDDHPFYDRLGHWREQGVFLLNTALSVETGSAGSHLEYWRAFTEKVVTFIARENPCVWMLWGRKARSFMPRITNSPFRVKGYDDQTIEKIPANPEWNYILEAPHPAAELYSSSRAGFYGCNHFRYANTILQKTKSKQITW